MPAPEFYNKNPLIFGAKVYIGRGRKHDDHQYIKSGPTIKKWLQILKDTYLLLEQYNLEWLFTRVTYRGLVDFRGDTEIGEYFPENNEIIFTAGVLNAKNPVREVIHEIGHHVYADVGNFDHLMDEMEEITNRHYASIRMAFVQRIIDLQNLWRKHSEHIDLYFRQIDKPTNFVSKYAYESEIPGEDFCETFASLLVGEPVPETAQYRFESALLESNARTDIGELIHNALFEN